MPIPESKFKDWYKTGADEGSKEAANKIEKLLRQDRSPIEQTDCSFRVLRQGSYKNTTHTYGSSDVDVLAKLTSSWHPDLSNLNEDEEEQYHEDHSTPNYGYDEFSHDVWRWLKNRFDSSVISWNGKAIEISDDSSRISVDVDLVPCVEHRQYESYSGSDESFEAGIAFEPRYSSEIIINYPSIHYENGCDKHTNYKETVRIFKNARDYYNEYFDTIWNISAHSYGIECLVYNVPEDILKRSNRSDRFDETLTYLSETEWSNFDQVSEMEALFGDSNTQWSTNEADELITRLREMWENWYDSDKNAQFLN